MAQLVVGLDIGTSAVRAAELDVSSSRPVLLTYGQVGLPPGSIVDGEIQDGAAVTEALRRLWANGHFSSSSVIVGIAGLRAITREIDLPFVPDNEVDSAVRFQSEEVIPFPPDQTILSSQILTDYTSPEGDKMRRVLVAAAHADLVNGVIEAVDKAGLTVVRRRPDLVRARQGHRRPRPDRPARGHRVGRGRTDGRRGPPTGTASVRADHRFRRQHHDCGHIRGPRRSRLRCRGDEAADRRGEHPAPVGGARRPVEHGRAGRRDQELDPVLRLPPGRAPVSRVLVTGGGSALHGLVSMLEAQTGLPVLTVSPLARLNTSKLDLTEAQIEEVRPVLATPIGLALPEPDKAVKKFNLLPPEVIRRTRMKRIQERTLLGCVAVVVLLVAFGMWKLLQVHNAQNDVNGLQTNISSLNAQIPKYDAVVAANQAYTAGLARRASVLNSAIDWPLVLNNLISITPSGAQVKSFDGASTATTGSSATGRHRRRHRQPLPPRAAPLQTVHRAARPRLPSAPFSWESRGRVRACPSLRRGSTLSPARSCSPIRSRGPPR